MVSQEQQQARYERAEVGLIFGKYRVGWIAYPEKCLVIRPAYRNEHSASPDGLKRYFIDRTVDQCACEDKLLREPVQCIHQIMADLDATWREERTLDERRGRCLPESHTPGDDPGLETLRAPSPCPFSVRRGAGYRTRPVYECDADLSAVACWLRAAAPEIAGPDRITLSYPLGLKTLIFAHRLADEERERLERMLEVQR